MKSKSFLNFKNFCTLILFQTFRKNGIWSYHVLMHILISLKMNMKTMKIINVKHTQCYKILEIINKHSFHYYQNEVQFINLNHYRTLKVK
jgi:hypothetical protein